LTFIAVFVAIAFLLLGYYAMDKIDKALVSNVFSPNVYLSDEHTYDSESKQKVILIYGDNELAKWVKAYCNSEKYIYEVVSEFNNICNGHDYSCLLALSYNDVDNLMIASIGLKVYSISHIIALCNNQNNLRMYSEFNFEKVLLYHDEMDELFNIVKEFVQNVVKNEV
jgi:hypothetical protein